MPTVSNMVCNMVSNLYRKNNEGGCFGVMVLALGHVNLDKDVERLKRGAPRHQLRRLQLTTDLPSHPWVIGKKFRIGHELGALFRYSLGTFRGVIGKSLTARIGQLASNIFAAVLTGIAVLQPSSSSAIRKHWRN